jgi:Ca2+-binding EF-hand superfamily protein
MIKKAWMHGIATACGLLGATAVASAQEPARPVAGTQQPVRRGAPGGQEPVRVVQGQHAARPADTDRPVGDIPGPIDSVQDLRDTAKLLFKLADLNNDNLISQKEAIDAGNLLVGGFFFRADANGDGVVSPEEARQARDSFLSQKPILRAFWEEAQRTRQAGHGEGSNQNPIQNLANMLDGNNDKQLQATELRKAVQTSVESVYQTADTNRDGQLSPAEINAALIGMGRAMAQAAFQAADTDNNGSISQAEFDKAIMQPAHTLFRVVDRNNDGQLSPEEVQEARRILMNQLRMLRVPETRVVSSELAPPEPQQTAPVPSFTAPPRPQTQPRQPAPAPAPR